MMEARLQGARRVMESRDIQAILVAGMTNIRYLSGFTGSDAVLATDMNSQWLLCDSRYTTQAGLEAKVCEVREYALKVDGIAALVRENGWERVGFDAEKTSYSQFRSIASALTGVELVPLTGELDEIRGVKASEEIQAIEKSAVLASSSFNKLLEMIRPGAVERDLALDLEIIMKRAGADERSFDFIVASGERGALPHGRASDKVLQSGDLVTFDFGACCNGYHSDETVTLAVGKTDKRQKEIYAIVKEAHDLAIDAVRPGISCRELDAVARGHIENSGFAEYFGHGLGHGVGLDVHEKPVISPRSEQVLQEGMVITIEPGIYIPGWGGVRIEDTLAVTSGGYRILTGVSKELLITG